MLQIQILFDETIICSLSSMVHVITQHFCVIQLGDLMDDCLSHWPMLRYRTGSTLVQVMACCLVTPSHDLSQCWHHQESLVPSLRQFHWKCSRCISIIRICRNITHLKLPPDLSTTNELHQVCNRKHIELRHRRVGSWRFCCIKDAHDRLMRWSILAYLRSFVELKPANLIQI